MDKCFLCPRECGVDRDVRRGACGQGSEMRVSRIAPHMFEEPCISGSRGSGTVFFCGCPIGCVFCQNKDISRGKISGRVLTPRELADEMLRLEQMGVHNINLVTPTHFVPQIIRALDLIKDSLSIPVLYNSSGYEKVQTIDSLDGYVDIYMPDFKYFDDELAKKYSNVTGYVDIASAAVSRMYSQVGKCTFSDNGDLLRGVIVRHLCLPSCRHDSMAVLERLAVTVPPADILLSLMSQYTPEFALDCDYRELHRRITSFEYNSVLRRAEELGFVGFFQSPLSACADYTPKFE